VEDRGVTVVKLLRYKPKGRWFDPGWCHWIFHWHKILPIALWFWVDSASYRNEYQEHFLGVKAAGARGWHPYHHPVPLSRYLGTLTSWNPLGHSGPVTGLIYLSFVYSNSDLSLKFWIFIICLNLKKNVLHYPRVFFLWTSVKKVIYYYIFIKKMSLMQYFECVVIWTCRKWNFLYYPYLIYGVETKKNSSGTVFRDTTLEKFARYFLWFRFTFGNFLYAAAFHSYMTSVEILLPLFMQ